MIGSGIPKFMKFVFWNSFKFHFKTSFDIFLFFKIVLGPMSDTEHLQHFKMNCTVRTMIASGLPTFKKIVCWNYF